jgi:hypothetical protein
MAMGYGKEQSKILILDPGKKTKQMGMECISGWEEIDMRDLGKLV